MKKQVTHFALKAAFSAVLLSACTLAANLDPSSLPRLHSLLRQYAPELKQIPTIDVGPRTQQGGAFLVKFTHRSGQDFKKQDSQSGKIQKDDTAILRFRVFLYQFSSPGPVPAGLLTPVNILGPYTLTKNLDGLQEQTILFKNVPAGNYYVGIAAFDSSTVFNTTTNISDEASSYKYAEGACFLSSTGGETSPNVGRVTIGGSPNYPVTGTPQLSVNLDLQDNIGAKLESQVNIIGGKIYYTAKDSSFDNLYQAGIAGSPSGLFAYQNASNQTDPQIKPASPFDKLVYVSDESASTRSIFRINTDGSSKNQMTSPSGGDYDEEPDWQPDGTDIVFVRRLNANSFKGELMSIPAGGGSTLTLLSSPTSHEHSPDWSSTNPRIVFVSDSDGNEDIYEVADDGTGIPFNQLRNTTVGSSKEPIYNPNGSKILFASNAIGGLSLGNFEIFVMDNDGTNQLRLTTDSGQDEQAVWSPDGTQIAWVRAGNIWVKGSTDTGTGSELQLTISGDNASPVWTNDGGQILYKKGPSTNNAVYIMTKEGKAKRQISQTFSVPTVKEISFLGP